jgi:G patch domain/KOW motif-containing protein
MGWRGDDEGSSSRNKKNIADDIMPRPQRLGLGAVPKMEAFPDTSSRKRSLRPDQVKQRERLEDQQKEYARERERQVALDKQRTMQNGSLIALRSGGGARAKIIQLVGVPGLNMVKVWPEGDTATSVVKRAEIEGLLTREELEDRPYREPKIEKPKKEVEKDRGSSDQKKERKEKRRREEEEASRRSKDRSSKRPREESERRMVWAIPNIRVRVITERLGRRYFKEKGIIVDVTVKGVTLRLDKSGTVLDRVPEDYLETALPKPGGKVIVLAGRNKYAKGKLLERDSKSSKGVVQIYEELNVLSLSLDDLAEWVGSLDDDME